VQGGQGIGDVVLPQVVADRHLAAETIPPVSHRHPVRLVWKCLDQHRHLEPRHTDGIGHPALFAKVGQGYQDTVDLVCPFFEQRGASSRILQRLDGTQSCLLRAEDDRLDPLLFQHA
jgi:hypothetical protein